MSKFRENNTKASKLTGEKVMEIREKYASGIYTYNRLAREYGVTSNTISNIVQMVTWQQLPSVAPQEEMDSAVARSMRKLAEITSPQGKAIDASELGLPKDFAESLLQRELPVDPITAARAARFGAPTQSKPAIQARSTQERGEGSTDAPAPERGDGEAIEQFLSQVTEESAK